MIPWDSLIFKHLPVKYLSSSDDFKLSSYVDHHFSSVLDFFGVLSPLWVWNYVSSDYVIIDGYKRYKWANKKGYGSLPCFVFPSSLSKEELLKLRVFTKLSESSLSLEERANIVERLLRMYSSYEVERKFLPLLRFPSRPGFSQIVVAFTKTPEDFRHAVIEGIVEEKVALRLSTWKEDSLYEMLRLLKSLRCSVSIQREILDLIEDIARLNDMDCGEVLKKTEIVSIIEDEKLSPRDKTERIRAIFKSLLFPNLVARERLFERTVKDLELPHGVALKPPDRFEGDDWEIKVQFSKPHELLCKLRAINSKLSQEVLEKIFYGKEDEPL